MSNPDSNADWKQLAASRARSHWRAICLGSTAYMIVFFAAYFWLLRHPLFHVTVMPLTALDRWIGFQPWSIALYVSLWLYVSLVPLLLQDPGELLFYLREAIILGLIGFAIFFFWPTTIPAPDINWALHPSVDFLKSVDAAGNACPSLHAAFAAMSFVWLHRLLRQMDAPVLMHAVNFLWCLGILYSTLATKQHVAIDLESGVLLGLGVAILHPLITSRWDVQ